MESGAQPASWNAIRMRRSWDLYHTLHNLPAWRLPLFLLSRRTWKFAWVFDQVCMRFCAMNGLILDIEYAFPGKWIGLTRAIISTLNIYDFRRPLWLSGRWINNGITPKIYNYTFIFIVFWKIRFWIFFFLLFWKRCMTLNTLGNISKSINLVLNQNHRIKMLFDLVRDSPC